MTEAVIIAAGRTPIGRAFKGSLISARPDDMAAFVVRTLLDRLPELEPAEVDDVIIGAAVGASEQGYNLGRAVSLLAGLPNSVPGATVNRMCASSLQAIRVAHHAIKAGEARVVVAGGVESVTRTASVSFRAEDGNPRFTDPDREDFVSRYYLAMGLTAENVADRYKVTRQEMDAYAKLSQDRAVAAQEAGGFDREIVPYLLPDGTLLARDDGPRPGTTLEALAELKPAFRPDGRVTAGNACPLNDGAAAVVITSDAHARELGVRPLARIVCSAVSGIAPEIMGLGPIEAVRKALDLAGMSIRDIGVVELNEAFAAQVLPVCRELEIDIDCRLNPHGGAIALGHPYGMTGARLMTALLNDLSELDRRFGLVTMCVGGGQGMAMIVERL
ncbi:acetyl-CoA C-acyltransferase [Candidatus Nephthysia bennettiae]|uniref:acetyl-CoA C-acyltransferase n=1 Tax=Candidatus Nephthysia bennettiae TaxID=3127016 RepID=A0A934K0T9_9BACT|nr:acetyl-CoA C-acyltransferase [Candidatus Dormibacteraeota bacterium]MBJ7614034.1 acetyl-CoA C-acyltransferase [Candidatus Dormibacteraeota bacterium]